MSVFGTVLLSALTLMHTYVFWRSLSVPFVKRHFSWKLMLGISIFLWLIFLVGRFYGHEKGGTLAVILEFSGMTWMAALFLLTACLLFTDMVTMFGLIAPRLAPSLRGFALAAAFGLSLVALVQGLRPPVVKGYRVVISGLPADLEGTVVVVLSDLHLGSLLDKVWLAERIKQVESQKPDMIVLLGDIFEGHGENDGEVLEIFRGLSAPLGVWAVTGNHEFHVSHNLGVGLMESAGFNLLRNRWVEVRPGFIISGVDDLTSKRRAGLGGDTVSEALSGRPPGATVFLSHTPWQADKAAGLGADLMLSGHTHGGQIWPFGYIVRLVYPLFEGLYEVGGMTVIVSRGTGTWGPRMRLWRPGEILRVELTGKTK